MLGGAGTWTKGILFSNHWFSGDTRVSMEVIVTIVSKLVYNPFRGRIQNWLVVSMIFYFHPYLGKWSNLTSIFSNGLKPPNRKENLWHGERFGESLADLLRWFRLAHFYRILNWNFEKKMLKIVASFQVKASLQAEFFGPPKEDVFRDWRQAVRSWLWSWWSPRRSVGTRQNIESWESSSTPPNAPTPQEIRPEKKGATCYHHCPSRIP